MKYIYLAKPKSGHFALCVIKAKLNGLQMIFIFSALLFLLVFKTIEANRFVNSQRALRSNVTV